MDFDALCLSDLTDTEERALRAYKSASETDGGQSFCFDLNDNLQSGLWPDELKEEMRHQVQSLDSVLGRCPRLTEDCVLYRGSGYASNFGPLKSNRCFRSLGFWSASNEEHVAKQFVQSIEDQASGLILILQLPAGLPVYNMETLPGSGRSERELLLPRGILWNIEKVEKSDPKQLPPPSCVRFKSLGRMTLKAISPSCRPLK